MIEVRKSDSLFLAIVLPVALVGFYFWYARPILVNRVETRTREKSALVTAAEFAATEARVRNELSQEKAAYTEAAAQPEIAVPVKDPVGLRAAARERRVLDLFRQCGLIVSCSRGTEKADAEKDAASPLAPLGIVPDATCRTYRITGSWQAFVTALGQFDARAMGIVVARVTRMADQADTWEVALWL